MIPKDIAAAIGLFYMMHYITNVMNTPVMRRKSIPEDRDSGYPWCTTQNEDVMLSVFMKHNLSSMMIV